MATDELCSQARIALASGLMVLFASFADAQENANASISIGAIKDQVESSSVRILAKYGESLAVTDKLVPQEISGDRGRFYTLSRQLNIDAADKGQFGGVSLRYGVKLYDIGMKVDPQAPSRPDGKPVIKFDGDKWMHVFPIQLGADADRNFKNHDYLIEAGYIPAKFSSGDSCFKLGANPIVGISGQLGRRTRVAESTAAGEPPEPSGSLRRLKIEGRLDFPISCILRLPTNGEASGSNPAALMFADIGRWQVIAAAAGWRDFVEDRSYKKYDLTVRIPTNAKAFIDLKREIGAAPTNFDTGAKFSANLTNEF